MIVQSCLRYSLRFCSLKRRSLKRQELFYKIICRTLILLNWFAKAAKSRSATPTSSRISTATFATIAEVSCSFNRSCLDPPHLWCHSATSSVTSCKLKFLKPISLLSPFCSRSRRETSPDNQDRR